MLFGILVTYRRPGHLRRSLEIIRRQTVPPDRLVVVDNDPLEENEEACTRLDGGVPNVEYIPCEGNVGPAGGFAIGMRRALETAGGDDWVVLLDDDDPPHRDDLLEDMLAFAEDMRSVDQRTGGVGMFGSRLSRRLGRPVRPDTKELSGPVPVDAIGNGRAPMYLVGALKEVGPFDPRLFFGLEELEFGLRLKSAGFTMYANGDIWDQWVRSHGSPDRRPSVSLQRPNWRTYYAVRNLIWIQRMNGWFLGALFTTAVVALLKPLLNLATKPRPATEQLTLNLAAVRDGWTGRLGKTVEPDVLTPAAG